MKIEIITEAEAIEQFDNLLDDNVDPFRMGYIEFAPSRILKELDPIAYREDFLNFINSMAEDENFLVEGYTDNEVA